MKFLKVMFLVLLISSCAGNDKCEIKEEEKGKEIQVLKRCLR